MPGHKAAGVSTELDGERTPGWRRGSWDMEGVPSGPTGLQTGIERMLRTEVKSPSAGEVLGTAGSPSLPTHTRNLSDDLLNTLCFAGD